jgi:hypothetical protein
MLVMAATAEGRHSRPQEMATSQKFRTSRRAIARGSLRNASLKTERDTTMKTTKKNTGIKVTTGVKAGGLQFPFNHNRSVLKVRTNIKAGILLAAKNHNRSVLKVRTNIKAGILLAAKNHSRSILATV